MIICTVLTGCGKSSLKFSVQYISNGIKIPDVTSLVNKINSPEQLQDYCTDIVSYGTSNNSFKIATKKYDDAFFEKKLLAVVFLKEGSGSVEHKVTSVVKTSEKIDINIKRKSPQIGDAMVAYWYIIIELEKEKVPEDAVFSLNLTGK